MTEIAVAILTLALCVWLVVGLFRAHRWRTRGRPGDAERDDSAGRSPYRTPADVVEQHDLGCDACAQLERINYRWKPPEMLLECGYPVDCVSRKTGIAVDDFHALAEKVGLVRQ